LVRRLSPLGLVAIVGYVLASGASTAYAVQLWYDGFSLASEGGDYAVDTALNGTSGGSGSFFTGDWVAADQGDPASWAEEKSPGLSRPGLTEAVVGGAAGKDVQFSCCVFTRTSRLFASPWGGFTDPDGTYYMGFLINFGTGDNNNPINDPHHRTVEMHSGGFDDSLNRNLMFGISNFAGLGNELALNVRDSTDDSLNNAVLAENANLNDLRFQGTHYVVLKFEMSTSTDDVISAFLDPVGSTEPAPSASITVGQFLADRMSTNAQFTFNSPYQSSAGRFDELRVGTTFADVGINTLPFRTPEPASISLFGLGAIGLILAARRKRA